MRRALIAVLLVAAIACGSEEPATSQFGPRARELVADMVGRRFGEVREALDPRISGSLTEEALGAAWDEFIEEHGAVRDVGPPSIENDDKGTLVTIGLDMAKRDAEVLVRFLPTGEIVGLDFADPDNT